jgi:hypothetical protein
MLNNENWDLNEVGKTLNKAADLMDRLGQAKHTTSDHKGAVCIQGAVYLALSGNPDCISTYKDQFTFDACFRALASHLPPRHEYQSTIGKVCDWNNDSARTKDEAVNFMRGVASTCKVHQTA